MLQVPLSTIKGTGKGGRILKEDVLKYLDLAKTSPASSTPTPVAPAKVPGENKTVPITGFQRIMVRTMTESLVSSIYFNMK